MLRFSPIMALLAALCAPLNAGQHERTERGADRYSVTARFHVISLPDLLADLSRNSGVLLECHADLKQQLLTVDLHGRELARVQNELALLLGGRWVKRTSPQGGTSSIIEPTSDRRAWEAAWRSARNQGIQAAREEQRQYLERTWHSLIREAAETGAPTSRDGGTISVAWARLLRTLPRDALSRLASAMAASKPVLPGYPHLLPQGEPYRVKVSQLSDDQELLLREALVSSYRQAGDPAARYLANVDRCELTLWTGDGNWVEIGLRMPQEPSPTYYAVFGASLSISKLQATAREPLAQLLSGALPGSEQVSRRQWASPGTPIVDLSELDPEKITRRSSFAGIRSHALLTLASDLHLDLIADYHAPAEFGQAFQDAPVQAAARIARDYATSIHLSDGVLRCRRVEWPDDDDARIEPAHLKRWIAVKSSGGALETEEWFRIAALSAAQAAGLLRFRQDTGKRQTPIFLHELGSLPRDRGAREALGALAGLTDQQIGQMRSLGGLPVGQLPKRLRACVNVLSGPQAPATLPYGRLRLREATMVQPMPSTILELVQIRSGKQTPVAVLFRFVPAK